MQKRKRYLVVFIVVLMSLALVASGCGAAKPAANQGASSGGSSPAKVVNIGYSGPLSGGAALYGQDSLNGLKMAVEEINGGGGITVAGQKYTINLIPLDDQYLPDKTATNARRLRTEYKTPVIFTPHSGGVFAMQQFNQEEGFLIGAYTSEPKILESGNKLTYRIPPPYDGYPEPFSKAVMEKYGKKVALIPGTHQYAKDWTAVFTPVWEKLGGTVTGNFAVDYNKETDFYTYVSKALATKPDVLFVGGASKPTAMVVKQARELGFKGGFIVMDQAKLEQMAETVPLDQLNGAIGVRPVIQFENAGAKKFVEAYKKFKNGEVPAWEQAWHYTAMKVVAKGMEKAGTVEDATKIFAGMKQIFPLNDNDWVAPIKGISDKGGMQGEAYGVMVVDGKYGPAIPISLKD